MILTKKPDSTFGRIAMKINRVNLKYNTRFGRDVSIGANAGNGGTKRGWENAMTQDIHTPNQSRGKLRMG